MLFPDIFIRISIILIKVYGLVSQPDLVGTSSGQSNIKTSSEDSTTDHLIKWNEVIFCVRYNPVVPVSALIFLVQSLNCNLCVQNGTIITLRDQARFALEVLPLHFKHNNGASFIRQLQLHGFRKVAANSQPSNLD